MSPRYIFPSLPPTLPRRTRPSSPSTKPATKPTTNPPPPPPLPPPPPAPCSSTAHLSTPETGTSLPQLTFVFDPNIRRSVRSATALAALSTTTVPRDPRATAPAAEDHDWVYTACALWAQSGDYDRMSAAASSLQYLEHKGYDMTSDAILARRNAEELREHERGCAECLNRRKMECESRKGVVNGNLERVVEAGKEGKRGREGEGEEGPEGKRRRVEIEGEVRGVWRAVMTGTF
ncbi:hypothetical protein LTR29_011934 [Friedmanniomyces endolithicus]|nr:hypothetical protein LTR29_011934 [Friedmanniomyces endolithicus]KAK1824882.1 hypothetical protein LTR12_000677 [Friedmanniomyces endolithicus]